MYRGVTKKNNIQHKKQRTYKGKGLTQSKPVNNTQYPVLPESPTNRPRILVDNNNLKIKINTARRKRYEPLLKRIKNTRSKSIMNMLFGRKKEEPGLNKYGYTKSYFNINKNKGFKQIIKV